MPEPGHLLTADTSLTADIYGVHGAAGLTHWKCLATRRDLAGAWEAVEFASIPPGGLSGEHRHTRTEEMYLILRGEGEFIANGARYPAVPGRMLLTGLGSVHGLRNVGDQTLDWLVIEMTSPAAAAVLRGHGPVPTQENAMKIGLYDLAGEGSVDPGSVLTGPWRTIAIDRLGPVRARDYAAEDSEHTLFVLSGSGTATSGDTTVPLTPGVSVTLPYRTVARVAADEDGLELFHAEVTVR